MRQWVFGLMLMGVSGLTYSCYEPKEGCLDIDAVNYQVDADRPCGGCCTYPVIRLDLQHKVVYPDTTVNLTYGAPYPDAAGNLFYPSRIRFYLSELRLVRPDGEEVGVEDKVELRLVQPAGDTVTQEVENNVALMNPGDFRQKVIGTIRNSGAFSRLRFTIGLTDVTERAIPSGLPAEHPLAVADMYRQVDLTRLYNRMELYRLRSPADTLRMDLQITGADKRRTVDLPVNFFLDPGFNPRIILRVDYLSWFRGVNLVSDPETEVIRKIVDNLTESFSIVEILAEER